MVIVTQADDSTIPIAVSRRWTGQRTCTHSVDGVTCDKKHFARGLCQAHYMRKRRNGTPGLIEIAPTRPRHLQDHQVVMARRRVTREEWTPREAAEYFGCSYTTMMDALRGKTFKHLRDAGYENR